MSVWFWSKLISWDRVDRHYAYLVALIVTMTAFFLFMKPETTSLPFSLPPLTWGSPLCTFWCLLTLAVITLQSHYERRESLVVSEALKLTSQVCLMLCVIMYYDGSNVVQRYRYALFGDKMLFDSHLLRLDEWLLGYWCQHGQLALCLDQHPLIGVKTIIGTVTAEILQAMYVSYYFWGNGLGVWLALRYFYNTLIKGENNTLTSRRQQWRRIQMFVCAWVGGFLTNFIINMLFPAVSPRIHLKEKYVNEIRGFFLADSLRSAIAGAAASTYSAFPSGHCGLSWLVPILAHRMGMTKFRNITIVAALLISLATLLLRYHYFVDFLFSVIVIYFAAWFGGFHTQQCYDESVMGDAHEQRKSKKGRLYDVDGALNSMIGDGSDSDDDDMKPLMDIKIQRDAVHDSSAPSVNTSTIISSSHGDADDAKSELEDPRHHSPTSATPTVRLTSQAGVLNRQSSQTTEKLSAQ